MERDSSTLRQIPGRLFNAVCRNRPVQVGAAVLGLLTVAKEYSYRNFGAYRLVNDLIEQPERSPQSAEWQEMVRAVRDSYIVGSSLAKDHAQDTSAAESLLRRVIVSLRTLETRSGGLDDKFTSLEDFPVVGSKLGSFGPLQIQPPIAAAIYVRHYPELKSLAMFGQDQQGALTPDAINALVKANDKDGLINALDLRGHGSVLLGVFHYLDLFHENRAASERLLKDPQFLTRSANRDAALLPRRTYSPTASILQAQLQDEDLPLSGRYVAQMAMTEFNAGRTAISNASMQCLLNEMAVLCGDRPSIVCDGALGTQTLDSYTSVLRSLNLDHDSLAASYGLDKEGASQSQIRRALLREIWFTKGVVGSDTFEDQFTSYLRTVAELSSRWDLAEQRRAYDALSRMFLGDGDLNKARGSSLLAIRDTFGTWLPERENLSTQEIATRQRLQDSWLKLLHNRDAEFLRCLDPEEFRVRFASGDPTGYGKFCRLLVERLATYHMYGVFHAEYPTAYQSDLLRGDTNPFARAYLGRQNARGVPFSMLELPTDRK